MAKRHRAMLMYTLLVMPLTGLAQEPPPVQEQDVRTDQVIEPVLAPRRNGHGRTGLRQRQRRRFTDT